MTPWITWRLLKFVGMLALAGGLGTAVVAPDRATRQRALYAATIPGMLTVWTAGWLLMKSTERSVTEAWILVSLVASLVALQLLFRWAHGASSPRAVAASAVGLVVGSVAAMVARTLDLPTMLAVTAVAALASGAAVWSAVPVGDPPDDGDSLPGAFRVVAWAEGASLLALVGVLVPVRLATGIELDGGTGALGWLHGMLLLVYLQSLSVTARHQGWGWRTWAPGAVAGVLPFGSFVFERWALRDA